MRCEPHITCTLFLSLVSCMIVMEFCAFAFGAPLEFPGSFLWPACGNPSQFHFIPDR